MGRKICFALLIFLGVIAVACARPFWDAVAWLGACFIGLFTRARVAYASASPRGRIILA